MVSHCIIHLININENNIAIIYRVSSEGNVKGYHFSFVSPCSQFCHATDSSWMWWWYLCRVCRRCSSWLEV